MKKYGHGVTQVGTGDAQCGARDLSVREWPNLWTVNCPTRVGAEKSWAHIPTSLVGETHTNGSLKPSAHCHMGKRGGKQNVQRNFLVSLWVTANAMTAR